MIVLLPVFLLLSYIVSKATGDICELIFSISLVLFYYLEEILRAIKDNKNNNNQ